MSRELVERLRIYADKLSAAELFEAADLIERHSKIIEELADSVKMYSENFEEAGGLFEDGQNEAAWEWIVTAQIRARVALSMLTNKDTEE